MKREHKQLLFYEILTSRPCFLAFCCVTCFESVVGQPWGRLRRRRQRRARYAFRNAKSFSEIHTNSRSFSKAVKLFKIAHGFQPISTNGRLVAFSNSIELFPAEEQKLCVSQCAKKKNLGSVHRTELLFKPRCNLRAAALVSSYKQ